MALIRFDKDHKLEVAETASELRQAITGLGAVLTPLVQVTKVGTDEKLWINAAQVREISETPQYKSAGFQ